MLDVSRLNLFQCENKNLKNGVTALSLISFSAWLRHIIFLIFDMIHVNKWIWMIFDYKHNWMAAIYIL